MMPTRKPSVSLLKALTETDKQVLQAIYNHRCLDEDLIYQYFYKKDVTAREYTAKRLRWMIQRNLIESIDYGEDFPALFLTTLGIETYRYVFDLPKEVLDIETGKFRPALCQASDLKMKTNNLRHQMALNHFGLEFERRADNQFVYRYLDEKFLDIYTVVRPDGMIQFNHLDLYLEMDMATEKRDALLLKWKHYREYLSGKEYHYRDKKIVMLFIVNNVKLAEARRQTILSTIQIGLLDMIDPCFEIYVDTPANLMDIIFAHFAPTSSSYQQNVDSLVSMIQQYHQFLFSTSDFIHDFAEDDFSAYIRKLNPERKILVQDGRPQEFLFDVYWERPMSVLHKITYYNRVTLSILKRLNRKIPYLIVVPDEKDFFRELQVMQIPQDAPDIYYTTAGRLKGTAFPEAVFQYDCMGNLFHFNDFGLKTREFERSVK